MAVLQRRYIFNKLHTHSCACVKETQCCTNLSNGNQVRPDVVYHLWGFDAAKKWQTPKHVGLCCHVWAFIFNPKMETSGSWVRPCLRADVFATHCFGPQHCSQTGGGVGPAPSTGSVGDNSHNYSGRWWRREANWRWDPIPVLLWQVMVPRDLVNWTTPLLTPAWYPCGSGISNPLHQRMVPCSRMSSTEGVTIILSLLDILQHTLGQKQHSSRNIQTSFLWTLSWVQEVLSYIYWWL